MLESQPSRLRDPKSTHVGNCEEHSIASKEGIGGHTVTFALKDQLADFVLRQVWSFADVDTRPSKLACRRNVIRCRQSSIFVLGANGSYRSSDS